MYNIVFFGSFQHYSTITLEKLIQSGLFSITAVVTTPPRPGDRGVITKTNTQLYCESKNIPIFPLENIDDIPQEIESPDFVVVCGYGKMLNEKWLNFPKIMALNIHQSLLPQYAGRFPAQWAILQGATNTGVTIIKMTKSFRDKGLIYAQETLPVASNDSSHTLYTKLYLMSAELAIKTLPLIYAHQITPYEQDGSGFYARQITKEDGYIDNSVLKETKNILQFDRMLRALQPWPGVWTYVFDKNGKKLVMKIISAKIINNCIQLENVLIEGKKPTIWSEIKSHYSLST